MMGLIIMVNINKTITVVADEVRLGRLIIDIAADGSFSNSRITVVAMIGIPSMSIDPISGFTLFTKVSEQEIYSGTLAAYTQELDLAVSNQVITNQQKADIIAGLLDIYKKSFAGFVTTSNILQANGKLQLKAKKVSQ